MQEALYGLWLESANDCAIAIAEHISGSETEFAKLLNKKADELNLECSNFVTPNGLFHENHYSTVKDLALITRYAMKNNRFMELLTTSTHIMEPTNIRDFDLYLYSSHPMNNFRTYSYDFYVGGKTGYINESKANMMTVASKDGTTLICVTGKASNMTYSCEDTEKLFNNAFKNYTSATMTSDSNGKSIDDIISSGNYITRHSETDKNFISVLLSSTDTDNIEFILSEEDLSFPIKEGTITGRIDAISNGTVIGTCTLKASEDMKFFLFLVYSIFKTILYIIIIALIISVLLILRKKLLQKNMTKEHIKGFSNYSDIPEKNNIKNSTYKQTDVKNKHYHNMKHK